MATERVTERVVDRVRKRLGRRDGTAAGGGDGDRDPADAGGDDGAEHDEQAVGRQGEHELILRPALVHDSIGILITHQRRHVGIFGNLPSGAGIGKNGTGVFEVPIGVAVLIGDDSATTKEIPPVKGVQALMDKVAARGHATFGGRLEADAKGFPASAMAKQHAGDWRDPDHVRTWVHELVEQLRARTSATPTARAVEAPSG